MNKSNFDYFLLLFVCLMIGASTNTRAAGSYAPYASGDKFAQAVKMRLDKLEASYQHRFDKQLPSNPRAPATITRPVTYKSPSSLRNLLKLKSLTPQGLAFTVALTSAGYLWDTDTEDVLFQDPNYIIPSISGACSLAGAPSNSSGCFSAISSLINTSGDPARWSTATASGTYDYQTSYEYAGNTYWQNRGYNFRPTVTPSVGDTLPSPTDEPVPQPITDDKFMSEVAPQIAWGDVVFDSDSPSAQPIPTPEYQQVKDEINTWYTNNYGDVNNNTTTNTTTNTVTNTSIVNNPDGSTTTTSETAVETEQPAFCNWAGIVCDLANWIMDGSPEPDHPEMPSEDIDIASLEVEWSSGLGAGSCPAPVTTNFNGQTITKDYTNECNAVSTVFKPILLFLTLVGAGFIVAGIKIG